MHTKNTACRDCGSQKLYMFLDLNDQPPANAFISKDKIGSENFYPLQTYVCEDCQVVQLVDVVDLDELFQNYVYLSSGAGLTTPKHFTDYASYVVEKFNLKPDSFVVEIGSNDGILLKAFKEKGVNTILGVDPAQNVAEIANNNGIPTKARPWSESLAEEIVSEYGQASLIVGNNVVAHINDHQDLFKGVKKILAPDGVFVFEAPYLIDMFEELSFDTIYHEHLSCLSLRPIQRMVESIGLEVFDIETRKVQGLSMRVFVGHKGAHEINESVDFFVKKEISLKMHTREACDVLAAKVHKRKDELLSLLAELKSQGKKIAGYGAPAKGNTLLNFIKIGPDTLDYLTEELTTKIGKLSPGMNIPVIAAEEARKNPPDYFLMLAWNYEHSILEREKLLREKGVKFIIPIGKNLRVV